MATTEQQLADVAFSRRVLDELQTKVEDLLSPMEKWASSLAHAKVLTVGMLKLDTLATAMHKRVQILHSKFPRTPPNIDFMSGVSSVRLDDSQERHAPCMATCMDAEASGSANASSRSASVQSAAASDPMLDPFFSAVSFGSILKAEQQTK
eukprot:gene18459-24941_t